MRVVIRRSICLVMWMLVASRVGAAQDLETVSGVVTTPVEGMPVPFSVGIHLRVDPSITSRRITGLLKTETEAIWEPYGVRIEWVEAAAPAIAANSLSLNASLERQFGNPRRMQRPPVLGRVTVSPDVPNGTPIRLSFDATESVLALRKTNRASLAGIVLVQDLARALGRVLAHEIGHVLLGAPYHDRAGLMRAAFRPEELAEADRAPFRLTCDGVGRLGSRHGAAAPDTQLMPQCIVFQSPR